MQSHQTEKKSLPPWLLATGLVIGLAAIMIMWNLNRPSLSEANKDNPLTYLGKP